MRTRSQACSNTKYSEVVQDDLDDDDGNECFCGVCEVQYGTELESKIW